MFHRLFLEHPRSVGESYGEHFIVASSFGLRMIAAGIACLAHGLFPTLFTRTGSNTVKTLYGEMKMRQPNLRDTPPAYLSQQWQPEYEI